MLLILFIGFKMVTPLFSYAKVPIKEITADTGENDNDSEKKADPNPKEKEFASIYSSPNVLFISHVAIVHLTAYSNNYQSSHFQTITIPPPDRA